jgi:hypothetical protein
MAAVAVAVVVAVVAVPPVDDWPHFHFLVSSLLMVAAL